MINLSLPPSLPQVEIPSVRSRGRGEILRGQRKRRRRKVKKTRERTPKKRSSWRMRQR
jgi:hypothetical protein